MSERENHFIPLFFLLFFLESLLLNHSQQQEAYVCRIPPGACTVGLFVCFGCCLFVCVCLYVCVWAHNAVGHSHALSYCHIHKFGKNTQRQTHQHE